MNQNEIRLLAGGYAPYPERWFEHLQICDLVADKSTGAVAMVMSIQKQRHMNAPDYFRLDFADGSYMDVSDNELSAEYRPYLLVSRITAAPELFEVLQEMVEVNDGPCRIDHKGFCQSHYLDHVDEGGCRVANAKAVIAKATEGAL